MKIIFKSKTKISEVFYYDVELLIEVLFTAFAVVRRRRVEE